jgi:glycosyltransferase involved in cell wall biosynthesis
MKIGIIAFGFIPGETGGTETYLRNLIAGLQKYDKKNNYTLVVRDEYKKQAKKLIYSKNWKLVSIKLKYPFGRRVLRKLRIVKESEDQRIAKIIDKMHFDVVHFPMQTIFPYGIKTKKVLTFMDMQEQYYPDFFSRQELEYRRNNYRKSAKEADSIIAISNYTKKDIGKFYGDDFEKKCRVVYLAGSFMTNTSQISISKNNEPYFYFPAATWPHKNHIRLIKAFASVIEKYPKYGLILTGLKRQKSDEITKLIQKLGITKAVKILGYLDYNELQDLYKGAFAMVFPSLFEGFGLPVLESMNMGVPVICSNTTSLPEVGGSAVLYFDPEDVTDIYDKMCLLIENKKLRPSLIKKGISQAKKFTLKKMITETVKVYNGAYNEK